MRNKTRFNPRLWLPVPIALVFAAASLVYLATGGRAIHAGATSATTYLATADTFITTASPDTAYGSAKTLLTCGNGSAKCSDGADEKRAFLKFDLTALSATPSSVKLRFYSVASTVPAVQIKKVTDNSWLPTTLTWNNGNGLATDTATYTSPSGSAVGWYETDVSGAVSGPGVYSFELFNSKKQATQIASMENTTVQGSAQLVVTSANSSPTPTPTTTSPSPSASPSALPDPVIAAAGDISTRTKTGGNLLTSDLILSLNPDRVITMGDNEYPDGALVDFQTYFDATWGRFKDKIYPAPGHHEYSTDTTAAGYFTYFGSRATPNDPSCTSACNGYYSYDLGNWHLIALNSNHNNCQYVACSATSAQVTWLRNDLSTTRQPCVLAYFADPRWSSGTTHGSNPTFDPIWRALYDYRADLVLNGHEHLYERFAKQNPDEAAVSDGIREITVGTGGNGSLYPFGTPIANSEIRDNSTRGVLLLTLHQSGYSWQFKPVTGGTFTDSGSDTCNTKPVH